jgi:hypothetical protein
MSKERNVERPHPASLNDWANIEVCEACRHCHTMFCSVHEVKVEDGYTCGKFGSDSSV